MLLNKETLRQAGLAILFCLVYLLMSACLGLIVSFVLRNPNIQGAIGEIIGSGLFPLVLGMYFKISPINLLRNIIVIAVFAYGMSTIDGVGGKNPFVVFYFYFLINFVLINATCLIFIPLKNIVKKETA